MGTGSYGHEPPYPRAGDGDYVPYREFDQLARRVERIETKGIGESLVRIEERQQTQTSQLSRQDLLLAQLDTRVAELQKAETQRLALRLGTKGLIATIVGLVGLTGTVVGIVVALLGGGG